MKLDGKVAIITGAATGIGRACARLFASEGATVVIADTNQNSGEETARQVNESGGRAMFLEVDLRDIAAIKDMVAKTILAHGRLDIYFHNAGVPGPGHIEDTDETGFDNTIDVNLKAVFFGAKFAIPELKKVRGANILVTSSGLGLKPAPYAPAYSASKAGVIMLVRALAISLAHDGIRVNAICPGPTPTPLFDQFTADQGGADRESFIRKSAENRPIRRLGNVEEMAAAALYLVSDDASYITGLALPVDGGMHAC